MDPLHPSNPLIPSTPSTPQPLNPSTPQPLNPSTQASLSSLSPVPGAMPSGATSRNVTPLPVLLHDHVLSFTVRGGAGGGRERGRRNYLSFFLKPGISIYLSIYRGRRKGEIGERRGEGEKEKVRRSPEHA
jgi:hypothetical protein